MNIEDRLRDAFAQRTNAVEVSPGALFEVQRQLGRTRRVPELRLRPALVLAAAACAVTAVVVSVSLSTTTPDPTGEIVASPPVASPSGTASDTPPPTSTPTTPGPQPPAVSPTPPTADSATPSQQDEPGQVTTVAPPTPPPVDPPQTDPSPPALDSPSASSTDPDPQTAPVCSVEPPGNGEGDNPTSWVTVYFACGESDAAPRRRPAAVNDLATALVVLLSGPNEADTAAGFRGLSSGSERIASSTRDNQWVTIDLPSTLADSFGAATADITAEQFLTQLNQTVFEFPEFVTAEYRLNGDCAAFGDLLGRSCEVHTRDGGRHTSELTAHTIGATESVIRAEPDDGATALGFLADGARLTDRRASSDSGSWAEVITTAGVGGWVSTETLVAQPLALDGEDAATMVSLARRLTTGPGIESSTFLPGGLVLRWGAGAGAVTVVSTAGAGVDSTWWNRAHDVRSPRDGGTTASLADLLQIDGASDSAVVTVNAPGPLGEPHADFSSLAYVSIYRAAVSSSILPPELEPAPDPPSTTTTEVVTTSDGVELPPTLPSLLEEEDGSADEEEPPEPLRAQISVIFDFLSPEGPRIAAVEAIWIEP